MSQIENDEFEFTAWDLEEGVEYLSNWKDRIYMKKNNIMYFRQPHETEWTVCVRSQVRFKAL